MAKLQAMTRRVDSLCLAQLALLFGDGMAHLFDFTACSTRRKSRRRCFTPVLTFLAFLSQVLDSGGSCRRALSRVQALCALKGLAPISESTSAYCQARARLSMRWLLRILRHLSEAVSRAAGLAEDGCGRLLVMDGTTITLPDSAANRARYPYANGQKPGCGFPIVHALGLFDLRTGACLRFIKSERRRHDAALAWRLLGALRAGDILVADRAFCSYAFISELQDRGVEVVMRLHQARARVLDMRKGRRLGKGECLQQWFKPVQRCCSKDLHPARYEALRDVLPMRLIERQIATRGHRPALVVFVTTLADARAYSAEAILALYLRRWEVEVFFDDIKTSQNMDMLRAQSPHMVARELLMHMITYNLVRLLMVQAEAMRPAAEEGRLSFKGTLDRITLWQHTLWASPTRKIAKARHRQLLVHISQDVVPHRPGRREPRVLKRRRDSYGLMNLPRAIMRTRPEPLKHPKTNAA